MVKNMAGQHSILFALLTVVVAVLTGCQTAPVTSPSPTVSTTPTAPIIVTDAQTDDIGYAAANDSIEESIDNVDDDIGIATSENNITNKPPVFKPIEEPVFEPVQEPVQTANPNQNDEPIFAPIPETDDATVNSSTVLTTPNPTSSVPQSLPYPTEQTPIAGSVPNDDVYIIQLPPADPEAKQKALLEQARQNSSRMSGSASTTRTPTVLQNGDNIPAFRRLMDTGINQLRAGRLSDAETSFTRAQRLAPQSSAVYFYLGQVALKKNQPIKAEAMARRGLTVAQSRSRKVALWQLILRSAQARGHQPTVNEAQRVLRSL